MDALTQLAEQIVAANRRKSLLDEDIVLPASVSDFIRSVLEIGGSDLGNEISRCFGIGETSMLIRKGNRGGACIVLRKFLSNDTVPAEHELTVGVRKSEFKVTIPNGTSLRVGIGNTDGLVEKLCEWAAQTISGVDRTEEHSDFLTLLQMISLTNFVRPQVIAPLHCPAFYLPADRTGVMHAHSAVVSALIRGAAMAGLRPTASLPLLSGVLADFIEQLIELDDPMDRRKPQRDLGTQIEATILGGSVRLERSEITGYPRFTYRPDGWKDDLPLMNASSMVSELAPVVLYLRHMVNPGNLLIVEEPESHPASEYAGRIHTSACCTRPGRRQGAYHHAQRMGCLRSLRISCSAPNFPRSAGKGTRAVPLLYVLTKWEHGYSRENAVRRGQLWRR